MFVAVNSFARQQLQTMLLPTQPGPLTHENVHDTILLELRSSGYRTACLAARLLLGNYLYGNYPPRECVFQPSATGLDLKMPRSKSIIDTAGVEWRQQEGTNL